MIIIIIILFSLVSLFLLSLSLSFSLFSRYVIYTALAWRNKAFGAATEFVWAADAGEYAIRDGTSKVRTFRNFAEHKSFRPPFAAEGIFGGALLGVRSTDSVTFYDWETLRVVRRIDECPRGVYWSEAGDLVAVCCEGSFYVLRLDQDAVAGYLAEGGSDDPNVAADDEVCIHS